MEALDSDMDPPFSFKDSDGQLARFFELGLGVWLFASAFLWAHSETERSNCAIVGMLMIVSSMIALVVRPNARWFMAGLGVWLIVSTFTFQSVSDATIWNDVIVAVLAFGLAMVPNHGVPGWAGARKIDH
jgi:hypothetical protein